MKANKLYAAADRAVNQALRLEAGEKFLLVTDRQKMEIAEALAFYAKKAGAETTTYLMTETLRPITEPTRQFKELIRDGLGHVYMLEGRFAEKPFRGFMVAEGAKHGRICMMPGITRDMMERLVAIDFSEMAAFTKKVMRAMKDAERRHRRERGRDEDRLQRQGPALGRGHRRHLQEGRARQPAGRRMLHGPGRGDLHRQDRHRPHRRQARPRRDDLQGAASSSTSRARASPRSSRPSATDPTARIIGEFGIGTNKGARICPNMLEAEKAFGTVHFAIGDSYGIGKNKSKFHFDALVDKVTITAKGKTIAKNGKFLI